MSTTRNIEIINIEEDGRVECISCFAIMNIKDYISLIDTAYSNKGGIEGQRESLKTSSAIKIRNRMIQDIESGAILPPVVLGSLISEEIFQKYPI